MLSLAEVGEEALADWKAHVDLGDHVFVEGRVISSRRGELSVMATPLGDGLQGAAPAAGAAQGALRGGPGPPALRRPHRAPGGARHGAHQGHASLRAIRTTLEDQGYLEVETPVLQLIHGGAAARPFRTHMNAFDQEMTLRIALELNLKKAVVGGVDRVYEMGRIFRNEGVDATHSPEFTMLEAYQAWGDQLTIGRAHAGPLPRRRRRRRVAPGRDPERAPSTSTASGAGCRCTRR